MSWTVRAYDGSGLGESDTEGDFLAKLRGRMVAGEGDDVMQVGRRIRASALPCLPRAARSGRSPAVDGAGRDDERDPLVRPTGRRHVPHLVDLRRPDQRGKVHAQTDSFHGRFAELVPDTKVVQVVEFETDDPTMQGEMTITYRLADAGGDTDLVGEHENLPPGVSAADNELGWRMSMDKLAHLVEPH